jgi:heat shock protein HslJ
MKYLFIPIIIFIVSCKPSAKVGITDNTWMLIELNGNPIKNDSSSQRIPQIVFRSAENKFNGNTGCNSMAGTYELKENNRILLTGIFSTKMACMNNMEIEGQFLNALEQADNYTLTGDTLILNKARMAPLARFKRI